MSSPSEPTRLVTLSPADAQALDAVLEARAQRTPTATGDADPRRQALTGVLGLLDHLPLEQPSQDLVERTLARVEEHDRQRRLALQIQALSAPAAAFRWRELAAVAAVVLIGLSLLWPTLAQTRFEARRIACQSRLANAGFALADYAADHAGIMPRVATSHRASWAGVGMTPQDSSYAGRPVASNPANLFLLVRRQYLTADDLACPDNTNAPRNLGPDAHDWPNVASVSYSYQNQFAPRPLRLDHLPNLAVLADKNPLFAPSKTDPRRIIIRIDVPPTASTMFHKQQGQNVLQASGVVTWRIIPILPSGDNIWTAEDQPVRNLDESPARPDDSMLVP